MQERDYSDYWRAALARHKARIAAGCISAVGAIRAGVKKEEETDEQQQDIEQEANQ